MTVLQEDADFLAHFGKKGMKWGVRNKRDATGVQSAPKRPLTPEEVAHRKAVRKKAIVVGAAATALIGAGVATAYMKQNGINPVSEIMKSAPVSSGKNFVLSMDAKRKAMPETVINKVVFSMANKADEGDGGSPRKGINPVNLRILQQIGANYREEQSNSAGNQRVSDTADMYAQIVEAQRSRR